jgi:demethylmenaquinone methyltransferase/2-methoxy-6-polyprenyl-1,4-benzoquinol methylase
VAPEAPEAPVASEASAGSDGRESLKEAWASPASKRRYVRRLFATIADRYDLITILLSFGRDARWKDRLVDLASPAPGERALDLACGTGDIAFRLAARGCRVCGLDITSRMVELARARMGDGRTPVFLVGDMMTLPFESGAFALVTTGYGLRNVPELEPALREILRVLRPGGRLLSLDFNRPEAAPVRLVYLAYLTVVGASLGLALHRDPETYRYIPESIRRYPGAARVAALLAGAGFADVRHLAVLGGLMAIHTARRP